MSARRRAQPWFLERPPYYVNERKLEPGGVTVWRDWSWDARTWFRGDGTCSVPSFYLPGDPVPPGLVALYPLIGRWLDLELERAKKAGDHFLGSIIARAGAKA